MPPWRVWYHRIAASVMCALFAGIALFVAQSVIRSREKPGLSLLLTTVAFIVFAVVGAALQFRTRRWLIQQFVYDGRALRFRTFGAAEDELWSLPEIAEIRESRGRAPGIGYRITHHNGRYVILDYAMTDGIAAALRMQMDLQLLRG